MIKLAHNTGLALCGYLDSYEKFQLHLNNGVAKTILVTNPHNAKPRNFVPESHEMRINPYLFYGGMGLIVLLITTVIVLIFKRKKNGNEKMFG